MESSLAVQKTLSDYCAVRERTLALLEDAGRQLAAANAEMKTVYGLGLTWDIVRPFDMETATRDIDERLWRQAFQATGFLSLMDAQALSDFRRSLERTPPPFTEENIRTTFLSLFQDADMMFARGAVNVFRKLSKAYRTNERDPFRLDRKAILHSIFQSRWSGGLQVNYGSWASGQINDLDRVFRLLDGKRHEPQALETAINAAFAESKEGPWVYEDGYFRIKGFLNGNAHFVFLREDLLEKANRLIGEHCGGNALAEKKEKKEAATRAPGRG